MKRFILCGLLGGLLATNAGCGLLQAIFCYRPCASCGDCVAVCGGDCCDEGCGPRCGPMSRCGGPPRCARGCADGDKVLRRRVRCACRQGCGRSCGPCDDPCADPCGNGCYGRCWHRGPLSCVFAFLMHGLRMVLELVRLGLRRTVLGAITTTIRPIAVTRAIATATTPAAAAAAIAAADMADITVVPAASRDTAATPSAGADQTTACPLAGRDNIVSDSDRIVGPAPTQALTAVSRASKDPVPRHQNRNRVDGAIIRSVPQVAGDSARRTTPEPLPPARDQGVRGRSRRDRGRRRPADGASSSIPDEPTCRVITTASERGRCGANLSAESVEAGSL